MYLYAFRETERGIRERHSRPKFPEPTVVVRTMEQVRAERIARDETERKRISERDSREARRREILRKIEYSLNRYREDNVPLAEKLPIRDILRAICEYHDVSVERMMGRCRQRFLIKIRDEAIRAVADARPDMSLPELGRVFANRDHTTILFSLRKTAKPGFDYRGNRLPVDSVDS